MGLRRMSLGALLLVPFLLLSGCGGAVVLPIGGGLGTTPTDGTGGTGGAPGGVGGVGPGGSSGIGSGGIGSGDPTPFAVSGTVLIYARKGADALIRFDTCQRAAIQHAADTLDPSFDPTGLCQQPAGTRCTGKGRYSGIAARAQVTIRDAAGTVVAVTGLGYGRLSRRLTLMGRPRAACEFRFRTSRVPGGSASYSVVVGPATPVAFSQDHAQGVTITLQD